MEGMLCRHRMGKRQLLLLLVSSAMLVVFLVTFVWRSDEISAARCEPLYAGDCNGDSIASAVGRRLQVARDSRSGLQREKAALQLHEVQQSGEYCSYANS